MTQNRLDSNNLAALQKQLQGAVIRPTDPGYDAARMAWNLSVVQHPALIVMPESAADVAAAVQFAKREGLGVAVQATGHGVVRPADDCLLINTARLTDLKIDPDKGTAWVSAGLKWGAVLEKTQEAGLAPLLGSSPEVGAVGYTLGGGFGWLGRKYGIAADSVHFFEVVTADGQIIKASPEENSDLFWALRGSAGGLGVIIGMEIQLYPVSTVYGGNLIYPIEQTRMVLTRFRDWIESAPDELTASIAIMNFPPLPQIPEFLRGNSFVMVRGCYCGPVEEGPAQLQSWRDWQAPIMDDFKVIPFSQVAMISNDPVDPVPGLTTGAWLRELSDEAIDTLSRYTSSAEGPSPLLLTELRHVGGAVARVDPASAAYGNREAPLLLACIGMTPSPEAHQHFQRVSGALKDELKPYMTGGAYLNFLEGEEKRERSKDGFTPEAYRRLAQVKAVYDPGDLFSFSTDIPAAA